MTDVLLTDAWAVPTHGIPGPAAERESDGVAMHALPH